MAMRHPSSLTLLTPGPTVMLNWLRTTGIRMVSDHGKVLARVLGGRSDANVRFSDLVALLLRLEFEVRVRGDHHIFTQDGIAEIVNLQPKGANAKPYQVRQIRGLVTRYHLGLDDND